MIANRGSADCCGYNCLWIRYLLLYKELWECKSCRRQRNSAKSTKARYILLYCNNVLYYHIILLYCITVLYYYIVLLWYIGVTGVGGGRGTTVKGVQKAGQIVRELVDLEL